MEFVFETDKKGRRVRVESDGKRFLEVVRKDGSAKPYWRRIGDEKRTNVLLSFILHRELLLQHERHREKMQKLLEQIDAKVKCILADRKFIEEK